MLKKIFNIFLGLVFVILLALFLYKTVRQPHVLSSEVSTSASKSIIDTIIDIAPIDSEAPVDKPIDIAPTDSTAPVDKPINSNDSEFSKEALNAAIKEYLMNNPEDIIASLENMQQQKIQDGEEKTTNYLKDNKDSIEKVDSPPIFGNVNGDISIVAFYDYNCSYCKKAHSYNSEIMEFDPGVKLIFRPLPILGGTSMYAAKVSLAIHKVAKEKFLDIHNKMMKLQVINAKTMKTLLEKHDIDYAIVENELNSHSVQQLINKNFEFAKNLGIQGAPSYIINGNFVPGLISVDKFKAIILQLRSEDSGD